MIKNPIFVLPNGEEIKTTGDALEIVEGRIIDIPLEKNTESKTKPFYIGSIQQKMVRQNVGLATVQTKVYLKNTLRS